MAITATQGNQASSGKGGKKESASAALVVTDIARSRLRAASNDKVEKLSRPGTQQWGNSEDAQYGLAVFTAGDRR